MTSVLFVRHVEHILQQEKLLGRTHDAPFTDTAYWQLTRLTKSPRMKLWQPYAPVCSGGHGKPPKPVQGRSVSGVELRGELDELDYSDWSGRRFGELADDPQWRRSNTERGQACPPHGESMRALQDRMLTCLRELARTYSQQTPICVTHAEPIGAMILDVCGMQSDDFARIEILPGSVTRLKLTSGAGGPRFHLEARAA